jgi:predicted O-linked N-acetylglucosamine transferase (SPINDLY family)
MAVTTAEAFAVALRYHEAGDLQQAERIYRQILEADPAYAEAHCNLGAVLAARGRREEAVAAYQAALRLQPRYVAAHFNLGNALSRMGQYGDAAASYRAAVRLDPQLAGAHYNLGLALSGLGRLDEAIASLQEAVRIQPDLVEAHNHLGEALRRQGRIEEAEAAFRQVLGLQPGHVKGLNNLGLTLAARQRFEEAVAALQQALRIKPDYAMAHGNLGFVRSVQGKPDEALASFQQALRLKPDSADTLNNLGNLLREQGDLDGAIDCLRKAVALTPHWAAVHSNLLLTLNYHPGYDAAAVFAEHLRWGKQHAERHAALIRPYRVDATPDRRLRVGYVSADFRTHPVASFIEPVLASHDRERFEVFCYSNVGQPDAVTERMRAHTHGWRPITGLSDDQAADLVRADAIDLLVDLSGHTAGNRLLLFARKPAPVQFTCFGYPNTTGLSTVDYRITDADADPPGRTEAYATEELLRLPEMAWCYQPPDAAPDVGPPPAGNTGPVTFGSLNNLAKVTAEVIALWARVLQTVPDSRLLLLTNGGSRGEQRVYGAFARHGVGRERVQLAERTSRDGYFKLYQRIDVALDPAPYNGGVTTCDALWMGVPVVALAGNTYVARQGFCLLNKVGLPDLAVETPDAYVAVAAGLANDRPRLHTLRAGLRSRMGQSVVVDARRYTRSLEEAYRRAWAQWCTHTAGGPAVG